MKVKRSHKIILTIIIALLISISVQSFSFIKPVRIGDGDTIDNATQIRKSGGLRCKWSYSLDTENITVTWYNNSVFYDSTTWTSGNLENFTNLLPSALNEGEIWNCTVILTNSSGNTLTDSAIIELIYDPLVYIQINGSYQQITNQTQEIYEDSTYNVVWNTTASYDPTEGFSVSPTTSFCSGGGTDSGSGTCSPNSSHLGTDKNTSGVQTITFKYEHSSGTQKNKINFTIIPVNDAPGLSNVINDSINEDQSWTNTITITDEEGNFPMNISISQPTFCSYTNASNTITFNCTPTPLDVGNFTIYINVTDNPPYNETYTIIPQNITTNFTLEVLPVNHVPNITYVSNFNASQNQLYNITMNATDIYDNNTLNFSITSSCSLTNPWTNVTTTTNVTWDGENFTSYGNGTWIRTLTNDHIVCRNITVTVTDQFGASNSTNIYLNISNVNDPPVIENYSSHPNDLLNNNYINNLTGYELAPFIYQINVTDPDLLVTYDPNLDSFNESLTYTSNDSWLNNYIDNSTGLINISSQNMNITPSNYSFLINVTDNGTTRYSNTSIMVLEVRPNDPPLFNQTLNFTCYEFDSLNNPSSCNINLSQYASDPNAVTGDSVANFSDDSDTFNVSNEGLLLFNATQDMVGLHTFNITITDTRGASNISLMYLYINNTNNEPNITSIEARDPPIALYYNKPANNKIPISASDLDLNLNGNNESYLNYSYERLTFTWANNNQSQNLTEYITISPNITNQTNDIFLIINTTQLVNNTLLQTGTYSINITVQDNYLNYSGASTSDSDTYMYNFTVYNTTGPPVITSIYPYGKPWFTNGTVFGWRNITSSNETTYINITENRSIFFNHTATDENPDNLTYEWYYDGIRLNTSSTVNYNSSASLIDNNKSLNLTFGFFEAGPFSIESHNLSLVVVDGFDETLNDTFIWSINVTDVNRPVVLNSLIPNITVEGSRNVDNKDLWTASYTYGFYDPDFDKDGDGTIELGESNFSITYSIPTGENGTLCQGFATINVSDPYSNFTDSNTNKTWIYGHGIKATATANGTCNVTFTATDGEFNATSNVVFLIVTLLSSQSPETVDIIQGSKTKTRTVTETVTIPVPEEIEKPIPIDIILPDMVTVYENNTIEIPLTVTNTWNKTVYGVRLDFKTANTSLNYTVKFQRQNFFKIEPGEVTKTVMTVSNYRVGGVYEILVLANVTEPPYVDSAKIYLNSIEQSTTGAQVRTLIKFARDLLQKNKECQELGEVLNKAEEKAREGELQKAIELVNSVINGCKYLISQEQQIKESPRRFRKIHLPIKKEYLIYLLIIGITGLIVAGGYTLFKKKDQIS
ncbi:MAG: hypothetical protein ISS25_02000 [Nanoarchaeota archaeon]|nr:hypothetical protein [DPANN group archaeon]MBL7116579.1 hypothetical protein [Nanoarchaeota archaeon]